MSLDVLGLALQMHPSRSSSPQVRLHPDRLAEIYLGYTGARRPSLALRARSTTLGTSESIVLTD